MQFERSLTSFLLSDAGRGKPNRTLLSAQREGDAPLPLSKSLENPGALSA